MQGGHLEQQEEVGENFNKNLITLMRETNYLANLFPLLYIITY